MLTVESQNIDELLLKANQNAAITAVYKSWFYDIIKKHVVPVEKILEKEKEELIELNLKALEDDGYKIHSNFRGYNYNGSSRAIGYGFLREPNITVDIPIHYSLLDKVAEKEKLFGDYFLYQTHLIQILNTIRANRYSIPDFLRKYFKGKDFEGNGKQINKADYEYLKKKYLFFEGLRLVY